MSPPWRHDPEIRYKQNTLAHATFIASCGVARANAGEAVGAIINAGRMPTRLEHVQVYIGNVKAPVRYAGKQPDFAGLDQINVGIPRKLIGRGEVDVFVTIAGKTANPVKLNIK